MTIHQPKLIIIADDLTGALDAAAAFCTPQTSVVVATAPEHLNTALEQKPTVVSVSTQSRELSEADARTQVTRVMEALKAQGLLATTLFKKVDSRLKGHVAAELDVIAQYLPSSAQTNWLVAPALPSFERFQEAGFVTGFGVTQPISIANALGRYAVRCSLPEVTSHDALSAALAEQPYSLLIGARDLAGALAKKWQLESHSPTPLNGNIALAIGSRDPITLKQIELLPKSIYQYVAAPSGVASTQDVVADANITLLHATEGKQAVTSAELDRAFAQSFAPLANHSHSLVLSGGATAEALLNALEIGVLQLEGELLPGIPVAKGKQWRIATKSGGFGQPDTLCRLLNVAHS